MAAAPADPPLEPQQRFQGVQKQSAGYRLLSAMGWREGEGLGASKQGIKEHIRVKKNFENWGVGAVAAAERARDWTTGMHDFHRVLSNLSEVTSQHARGGSGDSSSDDEAQRSDASDGPLRRAPAAGELSGRKKKKKKRRGDEPKKQVRFEGDAAPQVEEEGEGPRKKKKRKKEATGRGSKKGGKPAKATGPESDPGAAGPDAEEGQEQPEAKRSKLATHVGRFKKRETAKMVRGYSSADLAAILGGVDAGPPPPQAVVSAAVEEELEEEEAPAPEPVDKTAAAPTAGAQRAASPPTPPPGHGPAAAPAVVEGAWWSDQFHRAASGVGAGRGAAAAGVAVRGFREEDQEGLYNLVQNNATQGRVGLGRSSMPKKVAGAHWKGIKTRIASDSEGEGPAGDEGKGPLGGVPAEPEPEGIVIVMPRRAQAAAAAGPPPEPAEAGPGGGGGALAGIKWRKAAAAALAGAGGSLKLSRLARQLMQERGLGAQHKSAVREALKAAATKSKKLELAGRMVRLAGKR